MSLPIKLAWFGVWVDRNVWLLLAALVLWLTMNIDGDSNQVIMVQVIAMKKDLFFFFFIFGIFNLRYLLFIRDMYTAQ